MTKDRTIEYRPDIDGLRALAVLLVVAFHYYPNWIEGSKFIQGGFIGVDIFFVISGYLITSIIFYGIRNHSFSIKEFYAKRIRRIFPALLAMLTSVFLFGWYVMLPNEFSLLAKHILGGIGFSSNFVLSNEVGYFDDAIDVKPLLHLWSLGIEEQFYIFWPALLMLIFSNKLLALIIIFCTVSFFLNFFLVQSDPTLVFYSTFTRAWELILGGIIAAFNLVTNNKCYLKNFYLVNLISFIGILFILYSVLYLNGKVAFPYYYGLIPTLGACLVIISGKQALINNYFLSNRLLVYIGLISFPLYLWHWPLLVLYKISFNLDTVSFTARIILVIISFVLASLTYHLIEIPIRKFGFLSTKYIILYALCLATVASLSYIGKISPRHNGDNINKILASKADWVFPGNQFTNEFSHGLRYYTATRGKDKTLYIGDSNLEQYSSRINLLLKDKSLALNSVILIGNQRNCAMLEFILGDGNINDGCKKSYEMFLTLIRDEAIKNIVIAAQWNNYYNFLINNNVSSQSIEKLFPSKNIYLILTMPTGDELDPTSMFQGSRFTSLQAMNANSFNMEIFRNSTKITHEHIYKIADRIKAKVVDPIEYLCTNNQCPLTDSKGFPLYKDSKHMTSSYAKDSAIFIDETLMSIK
jgi:peptidoglycan/LPS O-acetylase OafA/YrhL